MSVVLGVGVLAGVLAYVFAYLTPSPGVLSGLIAAGLFLFTLPARAIRWDTRAARFVRPVRLVLIGLLVATAAVTILSRQIAFMSDRMAERFGFVLGDLLAVAALVFFHGRRFWAVATSLLPATVGLLVLASLAPRAFGFVPLTAVSGACFWAWAVAAGGPRRRGLALAAFGLLGAALSVGTIYFLPWAQPHVTRAVVRAYGQAQTGLSNQSELGEIAALGPSRRTVARVWTREPLRGTVLLRMKVFDRFDGRRWATGASPARAVLAAALPESSLGPVLSEVAGATFDLAGPPSPGAWTGASAGPEVRVVPSLGYDDGWGLLLPAATWRLRAPGDRVHVDGLGHVSPLEGLPLAYGAAAGGPGFVGPAVQSDLQLPRLHPQVRAKADGLGPADASPEAKLGRTIAFLQSGDFRYTLEVGRFATKDPVAEFLFDKKAGYCEYFASAAAVLLRAQGVPTRYVKGVSLRPESAVAGHHVVRESDAHAWVEAWMPGTGWVEADPTPPGDYAALHAASPPGAFAEAWESLHARVAWGWAWVRQAGFASVQAAVREGVARAVETVRRRPWLAAVFVCLAAFAWAAPRLLARLRGGLAAWRERRRIEAGRPVVPTGLRSLVSRAERLWASAGWPRPPARGLREHLRELPENALPEGGRGFCEAVVDSYYRAVFGGHPPSASELQDLEHRLQDLDRPRA